MTADPSSRTPLDELPSALTDLGYRFATGVPCSTFQRVIEHFSATGAGRYIAAANEGAALSLAAATAAPRSSPTTSRWRGSSPATAPAAARRCSG